MAPPAEPAQAPPAPDEPDTYPGSGFCMHCGMFRPAENGRRAAGQFILMAFFPFLTWGFGLVWDLSRPWWWKVLVPWAVACLLTARWCWRRRECATCGTRFEE